MPNYYFFQDGDDYWIDANGGSGISVSSDWYDVDSTPATSDVYVDHLRGDGNLADTLTGGATEDHLEGRGGADHLYGGPGTDTLDAGVDDNAADYLDGGTENDSYWSVTAGDVIIEGSGANSGYDTVTIASGSYVLPANVEEITLVFGSNAFGATGNAQANYIGGNEFGNLLGGAGGNDSIRGDSGQDTIYGDAGNDRIDGNDGSDVLYGGSGNDSIDGGASADTLNGGAGNDTLTGGANGNTLIGGDGNDLFWISAADDVVKETATGGTDEARFTQAGSYKLAANVEFGTVIGGGASVTGNTLANTLSGDSLANRLDGSSGNDTLFSYEGKDTLLGGAGDDTLLGGAGADRLSGGDGIDTVSYGGPGGAGGVTASLVAGKATDTFGNTDTLIAVENLQGSSNNDLFTGDANANTLWGFDGNDTLAGGGGNDSLDGQQGTDTFRFAGAGAATADFVYGFTHGSEHIQLDSAYFAPLAAGGLGAGNFHTGAAAADSDDYIVFNSATGKLYYDADGNDAGGAKLIATIFGNPPLDASDFQVI